MNPFPFFWLMLTFFCILTQGFFSMMEMASVSFNRVRLQYYVALKIRRAIWLKSLLDRPSRLFANVILGVNISLQIGSQSSREFYSALGLNPDLAPLTQVFLVVILAELCPLFAARKYAEHVVMLGMPILYGIHILFKPIIWFISQITSFISFLIGSKE
ncbi:MAG: DUF21 domain-containing protein, partial [Chlamydiia bacterium]|nr:DUF21 domain-containing protein [Chlamydiia bacterium]